MCVFFNSFLMNLLSFVRRVEYIAHCLGVRNLLIKEAVTVKRV